MEETPNLKPKSGLKTLFVVLITVLILVVVGSIFVIKSAVKKAGNYTSGSDLSDLASLAGSQGQTDSDSSSGSSSSSSSSGTTLDESRGVKCTDPPSTYYFKDGKSRRETGAMSMTSVNLQPNDNDYYSFMIGAPACIATKIAPVQTYQELRDQVIGSWEALQGKAGASHQYATQCEQADLSDSFFELPADCSVM